VHTVIAESRSGAMRSGGSASCKGLEGRGVAGAQPPKAPTTTVAPARVRKSRRGIDRAILAVLPHAALRGLERIAIVAPRAAKGRRRPAVTLRILLAE
jgi:hypothetical protein